ncbi:MAG TPA: HEPN domain-containing protein [Gammaproteobacteria bacterium]|nr:HEPN domain-containing protein [Gammaproteobacteria bacterium]
MTSQALKNFERAIQDAHDLLNHFDTLNTQPPPPEAEVLKRASLVMALAALETYVEDRIVEAADVVVGRDTVEGRLSQFYKDSLRNDLKSFHTPSTERIRQLFRTYLDMDVTKGWAWNNYDPARARAELTKIAKKRGDVAHRSWRPRLGEPVPHAVTRDDLRKHIRFIRDVATATDKYLDVNLQTDQCGSKAN